jgi:group 4 capsule polysaccharide lipoprotein GfcB/YjbF
MSMTSWRRNPRLLLPAGAAALGLGLTLGGCSSDGGGDWSDMLHAARDAWDNRDAPVAVDQAAAIPYATLGIRIDGAREQILVLAMDSAGERLWASSAHIAITTRLGRIVQTAGFGHDLSGFSIVEGSPLDWTVPHGYTWSADLADLGYYALPIHCEMVPAGKDPIEIFGKTFDTIRVDETCRAEKIDWTFNNAYWVNPETGRVWRAIEHVHPKGPAIEIRLLRPPLSAG